MQMTRREVLAGVGAAALGGGLIGAARVQALELGTMQVQTVTDGSLQLPGSFIFGPMPQDQLAGVLAEFNQSADVLTPPCNVTLLRDDDRVVLFDVGSGPDFTPTAGILVETLAALDVTPEDITHIVFTHAHPDHIWGLLDDFDDPLFPQARYFMGKAEFDYWMDPATVDTIDEARVPFAVGARRRMQVIEDQFETFSDGAEVLPGIAARACFGHTPGHMGFELRSGGASAMIVGDAIGNNHVAFAKPGWLSGSDQDLERGAATRISLLDQLAAAQMPMIGFHLPDGGMGRVERHGDAYRFAPIEQ